MKAYQVSKFTGPASAFSKSAKIMGLLLLTLNKRIRGRLRDRWQEKYIFIELNGEESSL